MSLHFFVDKVDGVDFLCAINMQTYVEKRQQDKGNTIKSLELSGYARIYVGGVENLKRDSYCTR